MKAQSILSLFPEQMRSVFRKVSEDQDKVQEIRLRILRPVCVIQNGREVFLDRQGEYTYFYEKAKVLTGDELKSIVNHICKYSLYAYEDELRQGFLTVPGGHRVGIAGQAVVTDADQVRTLKYISGLNIRVAHEIKGAADQILPYLYQEENLLNTLIISPPGCGKTTILRDMVRQVSDGNRFGKGIGVCVVDERSEIAGCFHGIPQNDIGMRTDVIDSCPKEKGMLMAIRSLSPGAVAIDELGDVQEWKTLLYASYCGTGIMATMHGASLEDYKNRSEKCLAGYGDIFHVCVLLRKHQGRCFVAQIYKREQEGDWQCLFQG